MFDTSKEKLTPTNILKYVDQWDIIKGYVPGAVLEGLFFTPFGVESIPSASIMKGSNDRLFIKDFGSPDKAVDCFGLVSKLYGLPFGETLERIRTDFKLDQLEQRLNVIKRNVLNSNGPNKNHSIKMKIEKTILVRYRGWTLHDKRFWFDKYNISKETLRLYNVRPISHFWINGKMYVAVRHSYQYYYFQASDLRYIMKIYQPYTTLKWISNGGSLQVIQGEGVLAAKGDLLIITKSLKDIMVLRELGYNAIAPQSEPTLINREYINKQKIRFKQIVVFFDNDTAGIRSAKKYAEQYNFPIITIPIFYYNQFGIKDISDYIEEFTIEDAKYLLKNLLHATRVLKN